MDRTATLNLIFDGYNTMLNYMLPSKISGRQMNVRFLFPNKTNMISFHWQNKLQYYIVIKCKRYLDHAQL